MQPVSSSHRNESIRNLGRKLLPHCIVNANGFYAVVNNMATLTFNLKGRGRFPPQGHKVEPLVRVFANFRIEGAKNFLRQRKAVCPVAQRAAIILEFGQYFGLESIRPS